MDAETRAELGAARSDEQIAAHIGALRDERTGYENRLAAAETEKDEVETSKMQSRIGQVDDEISKYEEMLTPEGKARRRLARAAGAVETADASPKAKKAAARR